MTILPAWIIDHESRKRREREREKELLRLPIYPPEPPQEPSQLGMTIRLQFRD